MLIDETIGRLRAIKAELELGELLPPERLKLVLHHVQMWIVICEGGVVRTCCECGTEFALAAARVDEIRRCRPRRELPRRCSHCRSTRYHRQAERDLAIE